MLNIPMSKSRAARTLWGLLGLMLVVKLTLVLSLADVFFYGEELEKGTAAKAMLDGLDVPHSALAYHYYEGGGFAVSHLTALAFTLIGENLWAHKLVSLGFNIAILLAGFVFLRRNFGTAAAVVFGLLYTFAPGAFQKLSLLNLGIHYESTLFYLLVFHFGTRLLCDEKPTLGATVGFGLAAGFGIFFNYGVLPLVVFWIATLLVLRRSSFAPVRSLSLMGSFVLGAIPLLLMWLAVGSSVFDIHGTALLDNQVEQPGGRFEALSSFGTSLVESLSTWQLALLALWIAIPILGLILALAQPAGRERRVYLSLSSYAGFFALLYVASPFVVSHASHHFYFQRLTPLWMIGLCLASATLGSMLSATRDGQPASPLRTTGRILVAVLLVAGFIATTQAVQGGTGRGLSENMRLLSKTKGYTYIEYFAKFVPHLPEDREQRLRTLIQFDEPARELLYADAAGAVYQTSEVPLSRVLETLQSTDSENHLEFMAGLGPYLHHQASGRMKLALHQALQQPSPLPAIFIEALGRRGLYLNPPPAMLKLEVEQWATNPPPAPFYRGLGYRCFRAYRLDPDGADEFMSSLPEAQQNLVRSGYVAARYVHQFDAPDPSVEKTAE